MTILPALSVTTRTPPYSCTVRSTPSTSTNRLVGVRHHPDPRGTDRQRAAELKDCAVARTRMFDKAVPTGFEPAISSLTGTYARPLHHGTMRCESVLSSPRAS